MKKWLRTPTQKGLFCGVITAAIQFWLIPSFLRRGIPDFIWIILMILLPVIAAGFLLHDCKASAVRWSLLAECIIVLVLCQPIGRMLGFRLESFSLDFFDFIAYLMFGIGWSLGAAAAQWLVLIFIEKETKKQGC